MDRTELTEDVVLEKMKSMKLFKFLNDDERKAVLSESNVKHFEEGEKIILQGETNPFFYAILQGSVNVRVDRAEKKEVYICTIGEGECFGEGAIFLNMKRTAHVEAHEPVELIEIERQKFIQFINQYPKAGIRILMLIIYSLLFKLKEANQELAFERKSHIDQDDIDSLVADMFEKQ